MGKVVEFYRWHEQDCLGRARTAISDGNYDEARRLLNMASYYNQGGWDGVLERGKNRSKAEDYKLL